MFPINSISYGRAVFILAAIFSTNVAGYYHQDNIRSCIPAEADPILNSSSCYPLVNLTRPFCQNHGISLPNYVYVTPRHQIKKNNNLNKNYDRLFTFGETKLSSFFGVNITSLRVCLDLLGILSCRHSFPSCDRTQSESKEQKLCRESCLEVKRKCGEIWKTAEDIVAIRHPENSRLYRCELQPYRNGGDSPECWYYNNFTNTPDTFTTSEWTHANCVHLNGSSYRGNISVTTSGIPCQYWTEQCPHRHTMNTTYPELNDAKNYCRNPQNSGQRPWCFTTDRNKRWEYCDIPKCIPVNGQFGNWLLSSTCNATCGGQGIEIWTRECNNPVPKYGGRNCTHLGEPTEYRPCSAKPCPVDGGYSNWNLSRPCNVSCGEGIEIWRRSCDNPQPNYGGRICNELGNSFESRSCSRKPCPKQVSAALNSLKIGIIVVSTVFLLVVAVTFVIFRMQRQKQGFLYCAMPKSHGPLLIHGSNSIQKET